ncbi:MAG: tRNA (5-methylaminomethyl-2-thiouridine)(34)-methyltransferase MnmD [Gracilimonas sp.]
MSPEIHSTKDGSSTLYSDQFDQFYHNPNGAATESIHVFFETSGLMEHLDEIESLTILEVGFGTGLNFLLLTDLLKERKINIPVRFYSIEAFPVDAETAKDFDFTGHIKHRELNSILPDVFDMIKPGMNTLAPIDELDIELHLFYSTFDKFNPEDLQVDYIFHDPFSPEVNEELWTKETFLKLHSFSKQETVLATYCAASKARGAMCAAGWNVARTQGALGKREMTLASLSAERLKGFKRVNEKRLAHRYETGDFD